MRPPLGPSHFGGVVLRCWCRNLMGTCPPDSAGPRKIDRFSWFLWGT